MQRDEENILLAKENKRLFSLLSITQKDNEALSGQVYELSSQNHTLSQNLISINSDYESLLKESRSDKAHILELKSKIALIEDERKNLEARASKAFVDDEHLHEILKLYNINIYTSGSEKSQTYFADQPHPFNDIGYFVACEKADERSGGHARTRSTSSKTETSGTSRKKKHVMDTTNLPRIRVDHDLTEEEKTCHSCGDKLVKITEEVKEELAWVPGYHMVREHHIFKYGCPSCSKENQDDPQHSVNIVRATCPNLPIKGYFAGASAIAHIIVSKYNLSLPLNRMEQGSFGISRQTMANWIINVYRHYFKGFFDRLKQHLSKKDIIHADET